MTPKEKAFELFNKYKKHLPYYYQWEERKQCALIAVDELIKSYRAIYDDCICDDDDYSEAEGGMLNYWQEVKKEIEKL
jgi:hypothetical protein